MDKTEFIEEIIASLDFQFPQTAAEWISHPVIENYHKHSDYSNGCITDSTENMENYARRTVELGGKCLYSGEHGTQGNQFLTYELAEKYGLKYRHSTEAYWVKDRHEKDKANCHIVLVAKNAQGRKDINFILSEANLNGYYYQPRIDLELLLSIPPENVIVTSACIAGWKYPDAEEIWLKIANHFGRNFYVEFQYHLMDFQIDLNRRLMAFARKHNLKMICGLDSHMISSDGEIKRTQYQSIKNIEYHHEEEAGKLFMDYPDVETIYHRFKKQGVLNDRQILTAMLNTMVFQVECEDIVFDKKFKIPNIYKGLTYDQRTKKLKRLLVDRYKQDPLKSADKSKAIAWEVSQFIESDTVDYPLFSNALVDLAVNKFNGILTKTSRGSAASFITNKYFGFTTVDRFNAEIPIHAERFLTADRIRAGSLPDIDFNCGAQEPFIAAARELLGEHGAYPLMTLSKLKTKNAWKMYARVNGIDPQLANEVSKALEKYEKALLHADEDEKDLIQVEDYVPEEYLEIFEKSKEYLGMTEGFGTHACGVLCLDGDIRREIGLVTAKALGGKKRTVVAAIEGKYLDKFGYLKQDFLIVDTVLLTHKLFASINQPVPSFEELKKMVKNDEATWKIYENGTTVCVNQCESEKTIEKVRRYKPRTIAELSSFIAAIRPGFKSLLHVFLERKEYTTGEPEIDKILSESAHFMLYQESIMAILSFLGIEMSETYTIIKSISKKTLVGEKKDNLLKKLQANWLEHFGNLNNFDKVWTVIEDAAAYAFNSPHSYSMAGDSLYSAWFKAHHTSKFYEVAIDHYQQKGNKDKMNALMQEAIEHYGYTIAPYEFGSDNRKINVDDETKKIHPPLSNIKSFGDRVGQYLFELSSKTYNTFFDLLKEMIENAGGRITSAHIDALIKINYFRQFGSITRLLSEYELYKIYAGIKTSVRKDKLEKNNLDLELALTFGRETKTMIKDFDKDGYFHALLALLPKGQDTTLQRVKWQIEVMGYSDLFDMKVPLSQGFVLDNVQRNKYGIATIYFPYDGKEREVKYWLSQAKKPMEKGTHLNIKKIEKKNKRHPVEKDGETVWEDIPDQFEYWLKWFSIED